jgi:hypothetical protein
MNAVELDLHMSLSISRGNPCKSNRTHDKFNLKKILYNIINNMYYIYIIYFTHI